MTGSSRFSLQSVYWTQSLVYGGVVGVVLGLLTASAAFRWGPLSSAGVAFVALLGQPPLIGLLLVGSVLLGGIIVGSRRPKMGWVEGIAFAGALLLSGLCIGGLIRWAAGPGTSAEVGEVYSSAGVAFLRIWLALVAEVVLWGICGMATGMAFNGLRLGRLTTGAVGAAVAAMGFAITFLAQTTLFQVAFPGGI